MKILIKDVMLLCMTGREEGVIKGDIAIDGEDIVKVGKADTGFRADKVIDGSSCLAVPGFVNGHTHAAMSVLRNYGDDLALMEWLNTKIFPAEEKIDSEWAYWGSMLSIIESIRSGCTAFADMYFFMEDTARAVKESGIRANLSRGVVGNGTDEGSLVRLRESAELYDRWNGAAEGRIQVDIAPHAPYTCSDAMFEKLITLAADKNTGLHVHLHETAFEVESSIKEYGVRPAKRLERLGLFGNKRVMAAHCVHLNDEDMELLAKYKVNIMHNPSSNLKLASGFAPVAGCAANGLNVCIGTDGASSNNNVNMCEELHIAAILAKAVSEDPKAVSAYEAVQMATLNGAKTLGIDHLTGTIETGKKADIAVIDMDKPHWIPRGNLISAVAYSMNSSDVKTVLCNGKILMENYELTSIDEKEVMARVQEIAERVLG